MAGLSKLKRTDTPTRVELIDPVEGTPILDSDGNPLWIEVHSVDSTVHAQVSHEITNRNIAQASRTGTVGGLKAETLEAQEIERVARCITAWHIVVDLDDGQGERPLDLTVREATDVLTQYPAVREQVASAMRDRARFLA